MIAQRLRIPARRVARSCIPSTSSSTTQLNRSLLTATTVRPSARITNHVLQTTAVRGYANGRPHPPGQTHRMDMSGGEEKSALETYGVDLTARAKAGKLDPVIGRDAEVYRTIQVLSRRTKNNPVLIGSAGGIPKNIFKVHSN